MSDIKIVEAPRPEPEDESSVLLEAFRLALSECTDILEMPGSPSLLDIPKVLKQRIAALEAENERLLARAEKAERELAEALALLEGVRIIPMTADDTVRSRARRVASSRPRRGGWTVSNDNPFLDPERQEAERRDRVWRRQDERDRMFELEAALSEALDRAEKAERERDEARADLRETNAVLEAMHWHEKSLLWRLPLERITPDQHRRLLAALGGEVDGE